MSSKTLDQIRAETERKRAEALRLIQWCDDRLKMIEALDHGGETETFPSAGPSPAPRTNRKRKGSDVDAGGETIRKAMMRADDQFTVPEIVNLVQPRHPDIPYKKLSRRASTIAFKLLAKKNIEVVRHGTGRSPNVYRRVGK